MSNKMLIDASHPEETRVVVVRGNRIEEFDFESEHKKQLKGNIYLARVTRVEPSLQAAFVEYGGNRHGFLAFSEIHPDYYQIPVADRAALLEAEAQAASEEEEEDEENLAKERQEKSSRRRRRGRGSGKAAKQASQEPASEEEESGDEHAALTSAMPAEIAADRVSEEVEADDPVPHSNADVFLGEAPSDAETAEEESNGADEEEDEDSGESNGDREEVESVGAEDALEEVPTRQRIQRKQYKIQEVIKRRQILLVQVVKEERGNKGAALTTYLSLAGRYSVLMPNTARGGGISRKITNPQDRKRLKEIVKDLAVPQGMGVILRTAGANRTKAEVKRDYEYLTRMWDTVRNLTLESTAPSLVYEEGSLIKRSIRDLYNKDISEILVAGEDGYREAKDFMRMLMPSHAKVVQPYREPIPIFARSGIEAQLDKMLQPQVTLKSGGYIIINQTEALVAIDVNSGRSTREHSIEDTALQTNLEAADEVARQLRLRDLAGLIVIDFIDMEEKRNNRAVEKRLKDCLKIDRARIQVGRISHFGLLEMSRQRIRASVLESTMQVCAVCGGTGHVRSPSSVALHVIRSIEEYLLRHPNNNITVRTPVETALYVLNNKRQNLADLEARFGLTIDIEADEEVGSQHLAIDKGAPAAGVAQGAAQAHPGFGLESEAEEEEAVTEAGVETEDAEASGEKRGRKRRRRSKRRRDREETAVAATGDETGEAPSEQDEETGEVSAEGSSDDQQPRKKRRRGRRGGRKNRRDGDLQTEAGDEAEAQQDEAPGETVQASSEAPVEEPTTEEAQEPAAEAAAPADVTGEEVSEPAPEAKPKRPRRRSRAAAATDEAKAEASAEAQPEPSGEAKAAEPEAKEEAETAAPEANGAEAPEKPRRSRRRTAASETTAEPVVTSVTPQDAADEQPAAPKRGGWWQKKGFF